MDGVVWFGSQRSPHGTRGKEVTASKDVSVKEAGTRVNWMLTRTTSAQSGSPLRSFVADSPNCRADAGVEGVRWGVVVVRWVLWYGVGILTPSSSQVLGGEEPGQQVWLDVRKMLARCLTTVCICFRV